MLIATVYDYRRLTEDPDIESTAPGSNNNERTSTYVNKNFSDEQQITVVQDNRNYIGKIKNHRDFHLDDNINKKNRKTKGNFFLFFTKKIIFDVIFDIVMSI